MRAAIALALCAAGCNASAVKHGSPSSTSNDVVDASATVADGGWKSDVRPVAQSCGLSPADPLGNAPPVCRKVNPPTAYAPVLKWAWDAPPQERAGGGSLAVPGSYVIPLVGNFTDDDGNGKIDLCDVPDVIVTTQAMVVHRGEYPKAPNVYMLAGDTGKLEATFEATVEDWVTPAFGDLDADGLPEVVSVDWEGHMVAQDNRGKVKWRSPEVGLYHEEILSTCHAMAIYDLDGDNKPEIISAFEVYDNTGHRLFHHDVREWAGRPLGGGKWKVHYGCPANIAADLDGDGKLEVIFGNAAYRADGSLYWKIPGPPGQPQVGNFDDDPGPEILVVSVEGVSIIEHDGQIKYGPVQLFPSKQEFCAPKSAVLENFDGVGRNDVMVSTCDHIGVMRIGATSLEPLWSFVSEREMASNTYASGTAFDFLGRGMADPVWDETFKLRIGDGKTGDVKFGVDRLSTSAMEYPVVVDVDNDGSVDILDVANGGGPDERLPTLRVYQDAERRWMPGRRIWNQHAYHVTNVREDGTIPAQMPKNWQMGNTFRSNLPFEEPKCPSLVD